MEDFLSVMSNLYRGVEFNVVEDENDSDSCIIYVGDPELVDDEFECLQITDLATSMLGYANVTVSHSSTEDLFM